MEIFVERCAGLDVHKDTVAATVRVPGAGGERFQETKTFGTTTRALVALREWLASHRVTVVGMESTGVYWRPVFYVLEERFECWLVNPAHAKNLPGRKSDVGDSAWLAQLVAHGLVRPSFVPPRPIRELRDVTRYRSAQTEERSRAVQRLDKVLQDAGVKLNSVASQTLGVSARAMLDALVAGERDPEVLAEMAKGRLRAKIPQLREALAGRFAEHHALMIGQILAHIDFLDAAIVALDARVEEMIGPFEAVVALLMTIPGVKRRTAEVIVAEIGADMSVFLTAAHLASWAGICPGNNESAGKHKSGKTRKGSKWLRKALTESAKAAARSKGTYLAAHHHQIRGRRGSAKATGATRHDILIACYHIIARHQSFHRAHQAGRAGGQQPTRSPQRSRTPGPCSPGQCPARR